MVWKGSNIEAGQEHLAGFICCPLLCLLCYFGSFLLDPRQRIALGLGFCQASVQQAAQAAHRQILTLGLRERGDQG
jgi:hypothetical protein